MNIGAFRDRPKVHQSPVVGGKRPPLRVAYFMKGIYDKTEFHVHSSSKDNGSSA